MLLEVGIFNRALGFLECNPNGDAPPREVVCIALGALAMGLQSAAVLALGVAGVPTTYETGVATQWLRRLVRHMPGADEWVRRATIFASAAVPRSPSPAGAWRGRTSQSSRSWWSPPLYS